MHSTESPQTTAPALTPIAQRQPHILVVDDEDMVRYVIKAVLCSRGYVIREAIDGEDAVAQYLAASPPIDLVLLDVNMPRLDGYEAITRIRKVNPRAKAVFLSGGARDSEEREIRELPWVAFLYKPFENQELLQTVAAMLQNPAC